MYTYKIEETVKRDELLAGSEENVTIINVEVDSGTVLTRGTVLAGTVGGKYAPITSADTSKDIVVVTYDAESDASVVSAYSQGKFHREKLIHSVDLNDFETEMRRQNIHLTTLKSYST